MLKQMQYIFAVIYETLSNMFMGIKRIFTRGDEVSPHIFPLPENENKISLNSFVVQ